MSTAGKKKQKDPSISRGLETTYHSYELHNWSLLLRKLRFGEEFINYK